MSVSDPLEALTVAEVAARMKVGHETVRRWLRSQRINGIKTSEGATGNWRVPIMEVERLLRVLERS
jgi:excisionase family DNA binding protein